MRCAQQLRQQHVRQETDRRQLRRGRGVQFDVLLAGQVLLHELHRAQEKAQEPDPRVM